MDVDCLQVLAMIGVRRRVELARTDVKWTRKGHMRWRNLPRTLFLTFILGHEGEVCGDCGWRYRLLWWSPSPLWSELVNDRGGGLLCPRCYDRRARRAGVRLRWTPMVAGRYDTDGTLVPTTNWWLSDTRDWLMMGVPDPDCFTRDRDSEFYPTQWPWERIKNMLADVIPPSANTWGRQEKPAVDAP